jgi:hypothetical protein
MIIAILFCVEYKCSPQYCSKIILKCKTYVKQICCCSSILYQNTSILTSLFRFIKKVVVVTLGIEILCIIYAEIGQKTGIYIFGLNLLGIVYHIL